MATAVTPGAWNPFGRLVAQGGSGTRPSPMSTPCLLLPFGRSRSRLSHYPALMIYHVPFSPAVSSVHIPDLGPSRNGPDFEVSLCVGKKGQVRLCSLHLSGTPKCLASWAAILQPCSLGMLTGRAKPLGFSHYPWEMFFNTVLTL